MLLDQPVWSKMARQVKRLCRAGKDRMDFDRTWDQRIVGEEKSNCLECQARRGAPVCLEARMPRLTDQRPRLPNSVSHPCDAGSVAHATVRACSEYGCDDQAFLRSHRTKGSAVYHIQVAERPYHSRAQNQDTRGQSEKRGQATLIWMGGRVGGASIPRGRKGDRLL